MIDRAGGSEEVDTADGVMNVSYAGYEGCLALESGEARVVLGPHAGGRVLEYSWKGENALFLDPAQDGWTWQPDAPRAEGERGVNPSGGRCDIGPEHVVLRRPTLWLGAWTVETVGSRSGRMTSQDDPSTGVRLVRDFRLGDEGSHQSHLRFTQTMVNVSDRTTEWCHWSRTFARHGGIGIMPLTERPMSRFPRGYVMYGAAEGVGPAIGFRPEDPNIIRKTTSRGDFLLLTGVPRNAKLGFDSYAGWLAYLLPGDLLFVKRFSVFPDRVYNEVAGITSCIYYPRERFVELEPIGPRETLAPGEQASFTEEWWLLPYRFPGTAGELDVEELVARVLDVL